MLRNIELRHHHDSVYCNLDIPEPQIRLLTIAPASDRDSDIHYCLRNVATQDAQQDGYEALSYHWGDPRQKHIIYVNEHPFGVAKNLYIALQYLRRRANPRTLWIDAICINQSDTKERNQQVRQMRTIFAGASQILMWLSDSDKEIEKAMKVLSHLSKTWRIYHDDSLKSLQGACKPVYPGLIKIFDRP